MLKFIASMIFFSAVGARRRRMEAKTFEEVLDAYESNDLDVLRDQPSSHEARRLQEEDWFEREFEIWRNEHNKNYKTKEERLKRYGIWKEMYLDILTNNANAKKSRENDPVFMILGRFSDLTESEIAKELGMVSQDFAHTTYHDYDTENHAWLERSADPMYHFLKHDTFEPVSGKVQRARPIRYDKDWYAGPVLEQGPCFAGLQFSMATALAGSKVHAQRRKGDLDAKHREVSKQHLLDCTASMGCSYTFQEDALRFIKEKGAMWKDDYPFEYNSEDPRQRQYCRHDKSKSFKVKRYRMVSDPYRMRSILNFKGPMTIAIAGNPRLLSHYFQGTMKAGDLEFCAIHEIESLNPDGQLVKRFGFAINHYMTLVGYSHGYGEVTREKREMVVCREQKRGQCPTGYEEWDSEVKDDPKQTLDCCRPLWWPVESTDKEFWILQNSWGTDWGYQGTMKVQLADGLGWCGMNWRPYSLWV